MDNIEKFPTPKKRSNDMFGASMSERWTTVVIDDFEIPKLHAMKHDNGSVTVLIDRRMAYDFPDIDTAYLACALAGNAMAIGQGYAWYGAKEKRQFAPEVKNIKETP